MSTFNLQSHSLSCMSASVTRVKVRDEVSQLFVGSQKEEVVVTNKIPLGYVKTLILAL